jgi:hypothetical protein
MRPRPNPILGVFYFFLVGSTLVGWVRLNPIGTAWSLAQASYRVGFYPNVHELFTHACYSHRVIKMQGVQC